MLLKNHILAMLAAVLFLAAPLAAQDSGLLPQHFGGWEKSASKASRNPADADAAFAPVLKEFAFTDFEEASYARPGRTIKVRAARFDDATGAYGAFTFYKRPQMLIEKIGDQGASANPQVLFYRGNVLVEATLDRITAMSAAELRELASRLPETPADARGLPSLPTYLPRNAYVKNSAKYVRGPAGLRHVGAPIPAEAVDFDMGAEVALGGYSTARGHGTLVLIGYPTPQIAAEQLPKAEAAARTSENSAPLVKRSGPMLALVVGRMAEPEARALLAAVSYEADVTWNERVPTARDNVANFLVALFTLVAVLFGLAIVVGVLFAFVRILVKRFFPDRVFDRREDIEIIRLNLSK